MPICPECGRNISNFVVYYTTSGTCTYDGVYRDYSDSETDNEDEFRCPECYEGLFDSREEADDFMNGTNEDKKESVDERE